MQSRLTPFEHAAPLSQRVVDVLRERILEGEYVFGERLSEAGIARQLGISRGPIREAFRQLRAEGLIRDEPRRGVFVVEPTAADVREIYDLRAALEVRAVRLMLQRPEAEWRPQLERCLERIGKAAERGSASEAAKRDFEFHEAICRLSGNGRLLSVFSSQAAILRTLLVIEEAAYFPQLVELVGQHRLLLDALARGNVRGAESAFNKHLEDAKRRMLAYLDGSAQDAPPSA